ncbi:hypothetical protein QOV31_005242 (plasmid) [Agrobacterium fabrum]|nr:hypothetical protein CN09_19090 [Rhizobium rhizogenes]WJK78357.1 hypothetical protein QOV31_005242 [Agrobacterium fabrum]
MGKDRSTCSSRVLCQRKPFAVAGTCWPQWKLEWDLPVGVTVDEVLARHSVPHLLEHLEEPLPLQVIEHRGMYNLGKGIQECTETSLLTALGEVGRRNLSELDAALTGDDVPIVSHDFNTWRVSTLPDKLVREFHSADVRDTPIIVREVSHGELTDLSTITKDTVPFLEPLLDKASEVNPGATIFLDGREFEAHIIAAWLSRRPKYRQRVVLLFYTFKYASGEAFVDGVREASPATDWRETVAVMPVIFPQELPRLAKLLDLDDIAVDDLYAAGKAWIDSMLRQEARVVAIHIMSARVRPDQLGLSEDPVVIRAFNADYAAVRLANYVKEDPGVRGIRPFLKLSAATRCYDFSTELGNGERVEFGFDFMTGRAVRRELDERKHIRRGWGTPGNAAAIADWVISDRSEDDMALWEWRNQGIDRQVDHYCPHLDVIEHQSQNLSQP